MYKTKKLYGGKKIGKGASTCVIKPAINCNITLKNGNKISKIMKSNRFTKTYIKINDVLKKLDKNQKYLIYFDESCYFKKDDIDNRKFKDIELISSNENNILDSEIEISDIYNDTDKFKCILEENKKYTNIIENYGGLTLINYINKNKLNTSNVNEIVYNLLKGIELLHDNKIIHRDIKIDNIVVNRNHARLIDFNISKFAEKQTLDNISLVGNFNYNISLDYLILFYIHIFIYHKKRRFTKNLINIIARICSKKYKNYINTLNDIKVSYTNIITTNDYNFSENLDLEFNKDFIELIKKTYKLYKLKTFKKYYTEEYIYKNDVYGLGIIIKIITNKLKMKNEFYNNLSNNMILFNPKKRFNITDAINYFEENIMKK